jgi:hypothetical protein
MHGIIRMLPNDRTGATAMGLAMEGNRPPIRAGIIHQLAHSVRHTRQSKLDLLTLCRPVLRGLTPQKLNLSFQSRYLA